VNHDAVDATVEWLELDIAFIELIELGLVEEMEINGEPHYGLTEAGMAYADQRRAA
jgi:hypothetical protein